MLNTESIKQFDPNINDVYAFRVAGEVSRNDLESMADYMNSVFDDKDQVDLLIAFEEEDGSETGASLNLEVQKAQFRSLTKLRNYCVAKAPDGAEKMIEAFDRLMPVEARTFGSEHNALEFLRAQPPANQQYPGLIG